MCDKNDREALKNISKFFGYLYWKVCAIESEKSVQKENNQSLLRGEEKDVMDKFQNRYVVRGIIVAETPIHIGAGNESMNPVEPDNSVIKDKDGKPYIPGSSLKGALRSWLESFLRGGGNEITGGNAPCLCVMNLALVIIRKTKNGSKR